MDAKQSGLAAGIIEGKKIAVANRVRSLPGSAPTSIFSWATPASISVPFAPVCRLTGIVHG